MTNSTNETRKMSVWSKAIALSISLGALAGLLALFYFFPFETGAALFFVCFVGWLVISCIPPVKEKNTHTITIKKG